MVPPIHEPEDDRQPDRHPDRQKPHDSIGHVYAVASPAMGHWGTCPPWSLCKL